eukprot:COSAG03_NODE_4369_length_1573_cov_6.875848_1_plen_390_part_10
MLSGQHTDEVRTMCCHQGTLLSGSSKLVAMDLRAFRGFGATLSFIAMDDCQDSLKVFVKQVKPRLDFYLSMLLQLYVVLQLASFGFNTNTVPEHQALIESMAWLQKLDLGLTSDNLFTALFFFACGMVCVFIVAMLAQEALEMQKFVSPRSEGTKYLWLAVSFYCQLMSTALFVPICNVLAHSVDCTRDESGRRWLDAMPTGSMECFQGQHWLYVAPGAALSIVYTWLCGRLMLAGGELQNVEMSLNLLDWGGDSRKRMPYTHALSPHSNEYSVGTVAVQTVTVLATTLLGTVYPITVAAVRVSSSFPSPSLSLPPSLPLSLSLSLPPSFPLFLPSLPPCTMPRVTLSLFGWAWASPPYDYGGHEPPQIMVLNGVVLVALTLIFPPYFGS